MMRTAWIAIGLALSLSPLVARAQEPQTDRPPGEGVPAPPPADAALQKERARAQVQEKQANAQEEVRLKEQHTTGNPGDEPGSNESSRLNEDRADAARAQALAAEKKLHAMEDGGALEPVVASPVAPSMETGNESMLAEEQMRGARAAEPVKSRPPAPQAHRANVKHSHESKPAHDKAPRTADPLALELPY